MKRIKNKGKIIVAVLWVFIVVFTTVSTDCLSANAKKSFSLSPMSQKIILVPGERYSGSMYVSSPADSDEDFEYVIEVGPYYPKKSENGVDDYGEIDYTNKSNMSMVVDWTTVDDPAGVLSPNERKAVPFTIDVPYDAPAGGQYMVLLVRENKEDDINSNSSAIKEIMQMGHVIYAEVTGETRNEGEILENNIPSFLMNGMLETASMVRNDGNVHTDAEYVLQVWPLFSDEEICTNEENPDTSLVLPETERYHTQSCDLPVVGIFRAKQTVKIFGETSITEKMVIVCPIWLIFIILFIIFALIFYFVAKAKARKKAAKKPENA